MNCHECIWGEIIQNLMSCTHPSLEEMNRIAGTDILSRVKNSVSGHNIFISSNELNLEVDREGVIKGEFKFPFKYNPDWIKKCEGFEQ